MFLFWNLSGVGYSKEKELVIGSRPPQCFNKCLNCRPCVAALVISQRHKESGDGLNYSADVPIPNANLEATRLPRDDSYYLLSWKCKCKDKYFQP